MDKFVMSVLISVLVKIFSWKFYPSFHLFGRKAVLLLPHMTNRDLSI